MRIAFAVATLIAGVIAIGPRAGAHHCPDHTILEADQVCVVTCPIEIEGVVFVCAHHTLDCPHEPVPTAMRDANALIKSILPGWSGTGCEDEPFVCDDHRPRERPNASIWLCEPLG